MRVRALAKAKQILNDHRDQLEGVVKVLAAESATEVLVDHAAHQLRVALYPDEIVQMVVP